MTNEEQAKLDALAVKFGSDVEQWPDLPERNDKCLCGSGLKFKRCCLPLLEKEEAEYSDEIKD